MKKSITILAAMAALLSTSCSDELNGNASYSNDFIQAVDTDLTCGVNVFMCSQDTISNAHVPLSVNAEVTAVADNDLVRVNCVHDAQGNSYLVPSLASPQDTTVTTSVKLSVPDHEDMNKSIIVSIRSSEPASRAATKDQVHERLTDVLSYGVYGDLLPGEVNVVHPALDPSALKSHVENHQSFRMDARTFKSYGTSIKEVSEEWSVNVGIQTPFPGIPYGKPNQPNVNVDVPAPKIFNLFQVFKGAFNMNKSSNEHHEKEYLIVDGHDYKAFGLLDDETATRKAGSDAWIDILSPRLNDLLHNPRKYEDAYPLDEDGAMKLIAAFGSHIPTQVLLGSGVRYETSKTIDAVENSFGIGISLAGENYKNNCDYNSKQAADINQQNAEAFKAKAALIFATGGQFVSSSGNIKFDKTKRDYAASTDQNSEIITIGNGSFNGDSWVAGSDPTDWEVLGYGCKDKTMLEPRLIPLYDLISKTAIENNKDVENRYKLLKAAIDAPSDGTLPKYLSYFGKLPDDYAPNNNNVICDFIVKTEKNINGEPFVGEVKCKDGVYRKVMYYPLRWSDVAGDVGEPEWRYCAFDAARNTFINLARTPGLYTHFYYAVIQDSYHYGIDAITFVPLASEESWNPLASDKNRGKDYEDKGWVRRNPDGSHCGSNIRGADCDQVVPYVHYRNSKSRWPAISAVCLFEDVKHRILASSAGTEYDESNGYYTENYNLFWKNSKFKNHDTTDDIQIPASRNYWYRFTSNVSGLNQAKYYGTNSACAYGWYRGSWITGQLHHIYVGYSFRKLPVTVLVNDKKTPLTALTPKKYE